MFPADALLLQAKIAVLAKWHTPRELLLFVIDAEVVVLPAQYDCKVEASALALTGKVFKRADHTHPRREPHNLLTHS